MTDLKRSCPAVSQSCTIEVMHFFRMKEAVSVGDSSALNWLDTNRFTTQDLPTPASPIITTFKSAVFGSGKWSTNRCSRRGLLIHMNLIVKILQICKLKYSVCYRNKNHILELDRLRSRSTSPSCISLSATSNWFVQLDMSSLNRNYIPSSTSNEVSASV